MKTRFGGSILATALLFPAILAFDAPAPSYTYATGSRVWVEGTSTVRSYSCAAGRIDGGVQGEAASIAGLQAAVRAVDLAVPVATLDCGNGTMNGHMFKALDVENNPFIRYAHRSHEVVATGPEVGTVRMNGTLTIAGRSNPVTLTATATQRTDGTILIEGSKQLNMTEFGVRPPRLMMGTLKVHDPVTVRYELVLKP